MTLFRVYARHVVVLTLIALAAPAWGQAGGDAQPQQANINENQSSNPNQQPAQSSPVGDADRTQQPTTQPPPPGVIPQPQGGDAQPQQPPEQKAAATELTAADIQSKITQFEGSTDLSETQRSEIVGLYRQALDQINAAASWEAKSAELQAGRTAAPEELERVRQELADIQAQPKEVTIPEGAPLPEYVTQLEDANRALNAAQTKTKELDDEAANRESRRSLIPGFIADANKRLENAEKTLPSQRNADVAPQLLAARRAVFLAQRKAAESEIRAYEQELQYYTARRELLTVRRERAKLNQANVQNRVKALEAVVSRLRQRDVEQQQRQAAEELSRTVGPLREIAERNQTLADERARVVALLDGLNRNARRLQRISEELDRDFRVLQESTQAEGVEDIVGPKLREKRTELLELGDIRFELQEKRRALARARWRTAEVEDERIDLADVETEVAATVDRVNVDKHAIDTKRVEQRARELFSARRDLLDALKKDFDTYLDRLVRYVADQSSLLTKVEAFRDFVDRHVLWSRSTGPITESKWPEDSGLPSGSFWAKLADVVLDDLTTNGALYSLMALLVLLYVAFRISLGKWLTAWGAQAVRPICERFYPTVSSLAVTLLIAGNWSAILAFAGWRLARVTGARDVMDVAHAYGAGALAAAFVLYLLRFVRLLCAPGGLAESHFNWRNVDLAMVRRYALLLLIFAAPVSFIIVATESYADTAWQDTLGRYSLIVGMFPLSLVSFRLLRAKRGAFAGVLGKNTSGWTYNLRPLWFPLLVLFPLGLAAASAAGFHYTAVELLNRLVMTVAVILVVLVLHALMIRWLLVAQRCLALRRARKIKASKESKDATAETSPQELRLELVSVGAQTRSLLAAAAVVLLAIGVWSTWADMLPAFSFLDQVRLWTYTVADPAATNGAALKVEYITLYNVMAALGVVIAAIILTKNIPGLLEITVLQNLPFDRGGRFAIASIARYTIGVIGILMAFTFLGVSWSNVQWLVAAMTVGLGFGLQEIFANFVSGLILLFERPIRVGDTVTVGNISGNVTQIRIRATTITDWDRKELVIPNREFVTGQVINWSLTDPILRIIIPVGIAYGSDTKLVESILYRVARKSNLVLKDPAPSVLFVAFGDSALQFELRVFIPSIDTLVQTRHELNNAIDQEFRKAGIEIAFPQRDLHIRSIKQALPIVDESSPKRFAPRSARKSSGDIAEEPSTGGEHESSPIHSNLSEGD